MRKKCHHCNKVREGNITSTEVFVCYRCQVEGNNIYGADKNEQAQQPGISRAASALGSIKTDKKAASSRENGKKGGRPKKCSVAYKNTLTGAKAPAYFIETTATGEEIYLALIGYEPLFPYTTNSDGNWVLKKA